MRQKGGFLDGRDGFGGERKSAGLCATDRRARGGQKDDAASIHGVSWRSKIQNKKRGQIGQKNELVAVLVLNLCLRRLERTK